ncbi:magnesium-translocating P-type ATPase [Nocardioides marmotae]|uniref:magnesium-translocating P-type ATPase n=1 Tax=Nocardioides marmotae TaxID=2663857 RepID=UPI001327FAF9|nr:magnesium-translocating P-type ATPase [Nocardioides marmotae]MBC9733990.1 magnesium-translocating P-type ATPase [Nocardioides marmotae]MTB85093.1 magnesium-translocating P-type ATPase [Nocardioides marmotae]
MAGPGAAASSEVDRGDDDAAYWASPASAVLAGLRTSAAGLSEDEAARRLAASGPNRISDQRSTGIWAELLRQFRQPVILVLLAATGLSLLLGDRIDAVIILAIVVLSGLLGFWQEHRAGVTVARLLDQVQIEIEVRRGGQVTSVAPEQVVPGDVVVLHAGDVVPCDCRVLTADSLQLDESALTGETYPRHKSADPAPPDAPLAERSGALFQGSHVVSGRGEAVAVATGRSTELGHMSRALVAAPPSTSFEAGTARFGLMLARVTALLTAMILLINVVLGRPFIDAVLFSLALAVGVTPQMLPTIVAVSLSSGARRMARAQVIVRRLDAIEDLGSMDVLCTDKTGTLTEGTITLLAATGLEGEESAVTADRAAVNAALQTGYTNPLDQAILRSHRPDGAWQAVAEVPFDFDRKRLSVLADGPDGRVLITKGAFPTVTAVVTEAVTGEGTRPWEEVRHAYDERFRSLGAQGYRVVAVAERPAPEQTRVGAEDERGMTLLGLLVFEDPPKAGLDATVARLTAQGIRLCMLTGDNRLAALHVAHWFTDGEPRVMTGREVDTLDDPQLAAVAADVDAFAELTPSQKERIVGAVRASGSVVGYLGDGINDAAPLRAADVGISVDTAVDVAKSAASMVLLDKDLGVVVDGVRLGRQTFANTIKYVYTTISANFGNTVSMAAASTFLPFLPLLPRQILLLNFLSDLPSVTIAADRVDPEVVDRPRRWDLDEVRSFMVVFGLLSSAFDLLTFAILIGVFDAGATLFQSGWFIGSTLTELAVLFVLRTRRLAYRSRPGRALLVTSVVVGLVTVVLPFLPHVADALGLTGPPVLLLLTLVAITGGYVVAAEATKRVFYRRLGRPGAASGPAAGDGMRHHHRLARLASEHGHRVAADVADAPAGSAEPGAPAPSG